ncbi:MAG: S8 family serine peptidase [Paracoccaceae bacterium]
MPTSVPTRGFVLALALALLAPGPLAAQEAPVTIDDPEALAALERLAARAGERPLAVPGEFIIDRSRVSGAVAVTPETLSTNGAMLLEADQGTGLDLVAVRGTEDVERLVGAYGEGAVIPNYLLYPDAVPNDPRAGDLWMIEAINASAAWRVLDDASTVTVAVIDDGVYLDHEDLAANIWVNEDEVPGNGRDDDGNGFIDDAYGWDFGEGDNDPNPEPCGAAHRGYQPDLLTHGTHVAGTIGAIGGNAIGVVGVTPKVRIMALKVGVAQSCRALSTFGILRALDYAVRNGADVINMSLGGPLSHPVIEDVYRRVGAAGALMVISAGNVGVNNDLRGDHGSFTVYQSYFPGLIYEKNGRQGAIPTVLIPSMGPSFPASYDVPEIVSVAAAETGEGGRIGLVESWYPLAEQFVPMRRWSDVRLGFLGLDFSKATVANVEAGELTYGSNFGATAVDIAAPGQGIVSTVPLYAGGGLASGYASMGGTSMAAPHVAGAAALLRAAFPEMTPVEVKGRLMATAREVPSLEGKVASGGLLDLYAALCAPGAPRTLVGCDTAAPSAAMADSGTTTTEAQREAVVEPKRSTPAAAEPVPARGPASVNQEPRGPVNLNEVMEW